jgi:tetratricopeptide (TPR) repeat protein
MAKKAKTSAPSEAVIGESRPWYRDPSFLAIALLTVVGVVIYAQTIRFDFVNLDDNVYITENPIVHTGLNWNTFVWAFTSAYGANWHPITWLSHLIDVDLFGLDAGGHHVESFVFHIVDSIILYFLIRLMTGRVWESLAVAAIFVAHPAHVESVAWVAERKDVISTLFWLLSTLSYVKYVRDLGNKRQYYISLVLFALGLATKPMLVTLPFTLLLFDYWPLSRFENWTVKELWPLVREKLPYFALAIILSIVTFVAQSAGGAVQSTTVITLGARLQNVVVSYAKYVGMLFYPAGLGAWYPFDPNFNPLVVALSAVVLFGVSAVAVWQMRQRKYLFVGWFWYVGTLLPVIGLIQVGRQALADRYTYVSYIGLSIAVVWLLSELIGKFKLPKPAVVAASAAALAALTVVAFMQTSTWRNTETMSRRAMDVTRNNYLIESNYCSYLEKLNRLDEAAALCRASIEHEPNVVYPYNGLGSVLLRQGRYDDARQTLQKALQVDPNYSMAYGNLAKVETGDSDFTKALQYLDRAIGSDKDGFFDAKRRTEAYSEIGNAALKQQKYEAAAAAFKGAIEASPDNPDLVRTLSMAYRSMGKTDEAIALMLDIIRKNPGSAEAYNTLGTIYAEQNRKADAMAQFQRALQINPNFTPARNNLQRVSQQ